jgi:hypothetical protein
MTGTRHLELPAGYDYDYINSEVIPPADLLRKHRADESTDIYFLSNTRPFARAETISFRTSDRNPEPSQCRNPTPAFRIAGICPHDPPGIAFA